MNARRKPRPAPKELVAYIARHLVNHPEKVFVTQVHGPGNETLVLEVDKEDFGRMVGKGGQIADAIRDLLKVYTLQDGRFYDLELVHALEDEEMSHGPATATAPDEDA